MSDVCANGCADQPMTFCNNDSKEPGGPHCVTCGLREGATCCNSTLNANWKKFGTGDEPTFYCGTPDLRCDSYSAMQCINATGKSCGKENMPACSSSPIDGTKGAWCEEGLTEWVSGYCHKGKKPPSPSPSPPPKYPHGSTTFKVTGYWDFGCHEDWGNPQGLCDSDYLPAETPPGNPVCEFDMGCDCIGIHPGNDCYESQGHHYCTLPCRKIG